MASSLCLTSPLPAATSSDPNWRNRGGVGAPNIILGGWNLPCVYALAVSGSDLYAGGGFTKAGAKVSGYAAKAVLDVFIIITSDGRFGLDNGQFSFNLFGPRGSNAVIQASTNLQTWTSLQTNSLAGGTSIFSDGQATNHFRRYYRAVLLP